MGQYPVHQDEFEGVRREKVIDYSKPQRATAVRADLEENKMDEVGKQLLPVKELLYTKGFIEVKAFHMSGGIIILHERERRARGPFERILQIIREAPDTNSMWTILEAAGLLWPREGDARSATEIESDPA